ncbi:MAG: DUF58 domain-containing protein [Eubacterium sp.]|nr:DUF58 domain-containing protein [Eubacterium sp.]
MGTVTEGEGKMLSILRGIAVTAVLFYISILYESASLLLLGYAGAVLLVSAVLLLVYRVRTVRCAVVFPIASAECGKPLTMRIQMENRGFLPCMKFRFQLEQKNRFLGGGCKKWLRGGMAAAGTNSFDYSFTMEDYGGFEIQLKKVRLYDLTGLFYVHKTLRCGGCVQVLPQMREIGVQLSQAVENFSGDAQVYDAFRPGDDRSELFQMREFRAGDKIQSVHWKLSAKLDELLVKENSLPKACPVVLFLDYENSRRSKAEKVNAYLVILASISFSLMDAGCAHYAAWYSGCGGDIVRVRVDDEESLYLFLSVYMEDIFERKESNLAEAYREKYRGEHYLYALQLDERLQLFKNGDKIVKFSLENWKEELGGLEIIL